MTNLDSFDLAILAILQRDNLSPRREIGEAVSLSASAVQRRIKRLAEMGVNQANVALVDPKRVGHPVTIFVEVEVTSETAEQIEAAKAASARRPRSSNALRHDVDSVLVIVVASMADREMLTRRLLFGNNNVKRFKTFVAMDRVILAACFA